MHFSVIELDNNYFSIRVDESLLIDATQPREHPHGLGTQIPRIERSNLAVGLFLVLGFLQGLGLSVGKNEVPLGSFHFLRPQALLERPQVVTHPNTSYGTGR
jgi:hypothetical protein